MNKKLKLFKVSFRSDYGNDIYVVANGFDEASEKGLEVKTLTDKSNNNGSILDSDGSLKTVKIHKVERVELLTDNFLYNVSVSV